MINSQKSRIGKSLLLASLLSGAFVSGGCSLHSYSFKEISKEPGRSVFQGKRALYLISPKIELSVCNEATYLGEEGFFKPSPTLDYVGRKDTFVEGEPIKFVLYRQYGKVGVCLADLIKNGEIDINRRKLFQFGLQPAYWLGINSYNGLGEGNYTIACSQDSEFLGKIDFQVIPSPSKENFTRK